MVSRKNIHTTAASELVGTLILTSLIILVIGIVAVSLLSQGPPGAVPALRVDIHNDSKELVLIHRGGDTLFREKTRLFVDGVDHTPNFTTPEGKRWTEYGAGDWLVLPPTIMPHRNDISVQIVHTAPDLPALLFTIGDIGVPPGPWPDPTEKYNLMLVSEPDEGGTVNGADQYEAGEEVLVSAQPSAGYQFINWTRNGVEIANTSAFTFTMPAEDVALVANFVQVEADGFTVEAWVRWNRDPAPPDRTHNFATIVVDGTNDTNRRYHLQHIENNTKFELVMRTGEAAPGSQSIVRSATTPERDTWYYVAGVYNQTLGEIVLYVNGVPDIGQQFGAISTAGLIPSPNLYQVGGPDGITWFTTQTDRRKFDGNILCLQTHERALTPEEILDRYNAGCPPVVNFTSNVTTGTAPLTVQFTDLTTHAPTTWAWDFGDGGTSTARNPTHTYLAPGTYTVSLTVTKSGVQETATKVGYIVVAGQESFVDFIINENVFVYGNVLSFAGDDVTGPGSTVVITGGLDTGDTNLGASIDVTTIYINGDVALSDGSAGLGSQSHPGNIYVNGNLDLWTGTRNIYGDVFVAGDFRLKDARIHGNVYVDGDLELGWTPWLADDARIYYTRAITHPANYDVNILAKCIHQPTVPGFDMPGQEISPTKAAEWYAARGYVSGGELRDGLKIYAPSYTGTFSWWPNPPPYENVIIIAHSGDIIITGLGAEGITGVFFAPKGKVIFGGEFLEGVVIARDGFFFGNEGTRVTFKNLNQYIGDPNDYPF
ncbi:PKD repeat protein [Methanocalculus alkaliphilus]|uniref:PKD domain-containing protein n=1 Tax=Methanocalculus alkaliphilus TaxID=768730 RepID=UPI0020A00840|nr:PKD domain-containing protein [Methanocalculus alkaliphilus]MCP1715003.1 PKD repeat protein [Methanocalculus alkaliphilus]